MQSNEKWWKDKAVIIAIAAVLSIATYLVMHFGFHHQKADIALWFALGFGGVPLVWDLLVLAFKRQFGADMLAGISIVSSVVLGEYLAGTIVVLMLSGGEALEHYALGRASSVLKALANRMPNEAHRKQDDELVDLDVADVVIGDMLVVLPGEICPVDGEVVEGHGTMDESYLTGEPYQVSKAPGSEVLSGAINGEAAITIRATKAAQDSRYARIMKVMEDAEQTRPDIRRLADQLGAWYTPLALGIAGAAWAISGDPIRFLAVLVVATPCPLLIGIPVALISAISLAAKRAIIIRDTTVLEQIQQCEILILDKTGTLTLGRPEVTDIQVYEGFDEVEVLTLAASLELYSRHPLSQAVVRAARSRDLEPMPVGNMSEKPGQGLLGTVGESSVTITSRSKLVAKEHPDVDRIPPTTAGLECVVLVDDRYAARFEFHDEPRAEGRSFVRHLAPQHAFQEVMLVSGDRLSEVEYLAGRVGIKDIYASQSPEQKVAIVKEASLRGKTLFVGDGVNDAPALMSATVGVALGQANEITSEAAGAVIMEPSLTRVDELMHIAQRFRKIALQSALGGIVLSVGGMFLAAFGFLPPVAGAIVQEVIDLGSILNSLRMAIPPKELSDMDLDT